MTKSEIFKAAHEMAKGTCKAVGNYMIAFKLAIKAVYAYLKTARPTRVHNRANRFGKPTLVPAVFEASNVAEYIRINRRVVRVFATLTAYNEAFNAGRVGVIINSNDEGWSAYEYF